MANEIKIKVSSTADVKGIKDADKAVDELTAGAVLAGDSIESLGDNMTEADRKGSKLERTLSSDRDQLIKLDAAIVTSTAQLKLLARSLADTDDAAQRIAIKKAMSRLQADLSPSAKARKIILSDFIDLKPDPSTLARFGQSLTAGLMPAAEAAGGAVGPVVGAAIGIAAAPTLLSAMGAAIASGAGVGVLGVGVLSAVKSDPKIQLAGKEAAAQFSAGLEDASEVLTGPILTSIDHLSDAGGRLSAKLGGAFQSLSDDLVPFTDKVISAGEAVTDVLIQKATESGPALDAMGDGLDMVGNAAADFLNEIVDTSPEAADNLRLVLGVTADLITQTGNFLGVLQDLANNEWVTGPLLPLLRKYYRDLGEDTDTLAEKNKGLESSMFEVTEAAFVEGNELTNLAEDMRAQTDPAFALLKAQEDLAEAQTKAAEAAGVHGKNSKEAKAALRDLAEAAITLESAAGGVTDSNGEMSDALRGTFRAAGLTEEQIRTLEGQFRDAKRSGDNFAKTYKAKIDASTETAEDRIKHVQQLLKQVQSKQISVDVLVNDSRLNKVANTLDRFGGAYAHGGIVGQAANGATSGGLTLVGEQGPELVSLASGSRVWSAGDSARMMSQGGGGGGGEFILRAAPGASRDLMGAIIEGLRYEVDRAAGGSVQRLLGSGVVTA